MLKTFYTVVSQDELNHLQTYNYLPFVSEGKADEKMDNWMLQEMKKRLPETSFNNNDILSQNAVGAHWLFPYKEDICIEMLKDDQLILEVVKDIEDCLFFNDNDWITVANDVMNNCCETFLAYTQKEMDDNINATKDDVISSWERMFSPKIEERDELFCGPIELRAVTPMILAKDVKKIISKI
jgi:hypothetical protein